MGIFSKKSRGGVSNGNGMYMPPPVEYIDQQHNRQEAEIAQLLRTLNLKLESDRLQSFQGRWSNPSVPSEELARWGFYYTGRRDQVECAFCRGRLQDWRSCDDPRLEHSQNFPDCPFVLGCMAERITQESGQNPFGAYVGQRSGHEDWDAPALDSGVPPPIDPSSIIPDYTYQSTMNLARSQTYPSMNATESGGASGSLNANSNVHGWSPHCFLTTPADDDPTFYNSVAAVDAGVASANSIPNPVATRQSYAAVGSNNIAGSFSPPPSNVYRRAPPNSSPNFHRRQNNLNGGPSSRPPNNNGGMFLNRKVDISHCLGQHGKKRAAGDPLAHRLRELNVFVGLPLIPDKATTQSRLNTFKSWTKTQKPDEMAEAGFYFTGEIDRVRCFYCGLALKNWVDKDVPWDEHERYNPDCEYILLSRNITPYCAEDVSRKSAESDRSDPFETLESVEDKGTICDLNEKTPCWRGDHQVRFAMEAGYEEEIISKALITNDCQLFNSAMDLIERIEALQLVETKNLRTKEHNNKTSADEKAESSSSNNESRPRKTSDSHHDSKLCQICMDAQISIVFLPCSHLVCCPRCSPAILRCPICRTESKGRIRIFF